MNWLDKTHEGRTSRDRLLTAAMDGLPDAIALADVDADGGDGPRVVYANAAFRALVGYDEAEAVGKGVFAFLKAGGAETFASLRARFAGRQEFHGEVDARRADGSTVRVRLTARPISDGAEWPTHFVLTLTAAPLAPDDDAGRESIHRYRSLIEANAIGAFHTDNNGNITFLTESLLRDYPLPESGDWRDLLHPDDRPAQERASGGPWNFARVTGTPYDESYRMLHRDGTYHWRRVRALPVVGADGAIREWIGTVSDVTEEREREEARRKNAEWLSYALEATEDGVYDWDFTHDRLTVSRRFRELVGAHGDAEVSPCHWVNFVHPDDFPEFLDLSRRLRSGLMEVIRQEFRAALPDGSVRWFLHRGTVVERTRDGKPCRIVGTIADTTERKNLEHQLVDLLESAVERADHDPLTGLYNHGAFHHHLERQARESDERRRSFAVAVMDVNHFKFFNDAYGHAVGDEVLKRIAEALDEAREPGDLLGRVGGDEFAIIFPDVEPRDLELVSERLERLSNIVGYRPPEYEYEIPLTLPYGVAFYPEDARNPHDLLELADERLRRSKQDSTAGLTESLREKLLHRARDFALLDALVTAVDNKDRYTRKHSEDVLLYSLMVTQELDMDADERATMMVAALVHDVGKIGVPDRILRRPGRLSDRDVLAMQQHVTLGAILVGAVKGLEDTVDAVRHHHERWDGRGYPDGLAGEAIPLSARIMAVADAFSAMTTDRPYRRGMEFARALDVLEAGAGVQWDPECVAALCRSMRTGLTNDGILDEARCALDELSACES
jgi:diguanylate cyclase (GGDEF)-like protein/PAS domain S-box-containing protein